MNPPFDQDLEMLLRRSIELAMLRKQNAELVKERDFARGALARLQEENATMRAQLANDAKWHAVPLPRPRRQYFRKP